MKKRNTILRACAVGTFTLGLAILALWSTGNFPPVAFANSGGGVTYRTLTKCSPTGGTILNSPTGTTFVNNTVVTLTADPNPGYDFNNWSGSISGSTNPINLTMNANKSVCAVFVVDNTIPVITRTGDATVYVERGEPYSDAGATATDNRDGDITSRIVVGGDTVDVDTPGTYTITYNVQDDAENWATEVTRTVIVEDTEIPVITLLGDDPVDTPLGGTYTDAGATALDDCEGDLTEDIVVGGDTVDSNTLGAYEITYDVEDGAGNDAVQVTRTVNVKDMTPPVITLIGDKPLDIHLDGSYSDPGATASDNLDGDLTASIVVSGDTVDTETTGVYSVTYNVTDAAGNAAVEVTREVRIWPSLEIDVEGTGGTSPLAGQTHHFAPGSVVDLYALADNVDHMFDEWTGDAVADSASAVTTILMDGPKSVTANFVEGHMLATSVASGLGEIVLDPSRPLYREGAQVTVTATPENGYEFDHWVIDGTIVSGTVNDSTLTLEMNTDASAAAHFNQLSYSLSIATTGDGSVLPATGTYHYGDPLTLTATPDSGWYFAYWTGGLSGVENVKNLTVTGSITATAVFVEDFTLTVNTDGDGSVSPTGGTYIPGDPVSLTATADSGWRFDHWEGDFDRQDNPLNITMRDNYTVTAVFVEDPYLTVSTIGEGTVTLSPTQPPGGYAPSTNVSLTATPASGWLFEGWSGALSGSDNPESVTTPVASEIVAEFREARTLTITKTGSGTGTVQVSDAIRTYAANPNGTYTVPMGSVLILTPSATSGCFYHWEGAVTGAASPGVLEVTGNHAVTALFAEKAVVELRVIGEGEITLEPEQPVGGYCPGTEITVTAVPDEDWVFREWQGLPNLEWAPSQPFVALPGPTFIALVLDERPGIDDLQMVADLGEYLVAIGVYTDSEDVEAYDYDFGDEDLGGSDFVYIPNGIPDAAELASLQDILQTPAIELSDGGVSHMALWRIYLANLAQAEEDLEVEAPAIQRAVASYMTLGTFGHRGKVVKDVQARFSVTLDVSLYENGGGRWFESAKNMDGDAVSNKAEWEHAIGEAASQSQGPPLAAAAYAAAASDKASDEGTSVYDLPTDGEPEDFGNSCGPGLASVSVRQVSEVLHNLSVTARAVIPDGSKTVVIGEGQSKHLPLGTVVHVRAIESSWFDGWYAEGTLLSGSNSPDDSFILTESTDIIGFIKGSHRVEYSEYPSSRVIVEVAGGDDPFVIARGNGYVGNKSIQVRDGTLLSLTARADFPFDLWLKVYSDYGDSALNQQANTSIDPDGVTLVELLGGSAHFGYADFDTSSGNGYATGDLGTTSKPPFLGSVRYSLPNPASAPWSKSPHADHHPNRGYYPKNLNTPLLTDTAPSGTATAEIAPMTNLTLKPAECLKDCDVNEHGIATFINGKRYYYGPTMHVANGELAGVASKPDKFHKFEGFKVSGGGGVYKWSGGGAPDDFFDLDGFDEAEEDDGFYIDDPIYIEMSQDASVTPVYTLVTPKSHIFEPSVGCPIGGSWGPMHIATGCNGDSITLECDGDYFYRKGETLIGHCIYWGGQNWFGFEYIEWAGGDLLWAGMHITQDNPCFRQLDSRYDSGAQYKVDYTVSYVPFYPASEPFSISPGSGSVSMIQSCFLSLYDIGYVDPEFRSAWQ